jgi:hypothetical protein
VNISQTEIKHLIGNQDDESRLLVGSSGAPDPSRVGSDLMGFRLDRRIRY